jgi:GntR family transcriptional regulator
MLPFPVHLRPGDVPVRHVVFAATKAILAGVLSPGDKFPSVRDMSESLRIHPNTAQKVISELVRDGFLLVQPGVGTVVTLPPPVDNNVRGHILEEALDHLVVEARRQAWTLSQLADAVEEQWLATFGDIGTSPVRLRAPESRIPSQRRFT